jgi:hypothetical protein
METVIAQSLLIDWKVPIGTIVLFGAQFIIGIIAVMRALARIERSIDTRFAHFELALNTFKVGDLQTLQTSVQRLETGADEWTKSLRHRTHELGNTVNDLMLRVDRLERPERFERRKTDHQES